VRGYLAGLAPGPRKHLKALRAAHKEYQLAKGTIRFPHDRPVPVSLVKKLIKARAAELRAT